MRYIFSDESFCYVCTLVLFIEINNAKIVSYLNSILFYKKVASTIIWVILVYLLLHCFILNMIYSITILSFR